MTPGPRPLVAPAAALTDAERRRYSRQVLLPGVGDDGQRRLKAARVLCIGAGGLGSPVLLYLAAAGVGTIGVVDFDVVDESNLQRQIIHGHGDVGEAKVTSAAAALRRANPLVDVRRHAVRLDATNALALFADYDLVVDGTDNFATRYLVNDACVLLGTPYVWASVFRFDAQVAVFWAQAGPCYRCLYPSPPPPGQVPSCAEAGVLGALCGVTGSLQAIEAVKLITGVGDPLLGRVLLIDALTGEQRTVAVGKDPGCAACGPAPTVTALQDDDARCAGPADTELDVAQVRDLLAARERGASDFLLVDVREPVEHALAAIPGSVLVPSGGILDGSALARLPRDRRLVLYCQVGLRSGAALAALVAAGYRDVAHLAGGMRAWDAPPPPRPGP